MSEEGNEGTGVSRSVTFQVTTRKKTGSHEREFIKISIPRFSGGSAQEWLQWIQQFEHVSKMKKWSSEEKAQHLCLVLDDEALDAWVDTSGSEDMADQDTFDDAYQKWGHMFVPSMYHERLEEELFLFAKRRHESVAECHQRMRQITRMRKKLPTNTLVVDEQSMIQTFKRVTPKEWKTSYEFSGVHLTTMPNPVQ